MKKLLIAYFTALISLCLYASTTQAKGLNFNLLKSTPIGSWQVREDTETNHKGKKTVMSVRTSMLGSEERNGEKHYWIEASIDSFKVSKKGKRKKNGDRVTVKTLVAESVFQSNGENMLANLAGFGAETIFQTGKDQPMRMSDSGGMMSGMMKSFGAQVTHEYSEQGAEKVTIPAGEFDTKKINGTGSVDMKVMFKKINVESESTAWVSDKVPFGIVKGETTSITNGKTSTTSSELLEYGTSGAQSQISGEPQDMPEMPDLGGLFK